MMLTNAWCPSVKCGMDDTQGFKAVPLSVHGSSAVDNLGKNAFCGPRNFTYDMISRKTMT